MSEKKENLKIAIASDAFPPTTDGVSTVAANYAAELHAAGQEPVIVTPKNPNARDSDYDFEIFRYKGLWFPSKEGYSIGWPFNQKWSQKIINRNFDILHTHAPLASSYYFRLVNRKKRMPTILTYHTKYEYDIDRRIPTKPAKDFARSFLLNNINSADEVWVTSLGSKESLQKLGYTGDVILMQNGCDMPRRDIADDVKSSLRRAHAIPANMPVYIYTGRMIWYKNINIILEALQKLNRLGKDFRLIMLGFGADEAQIKRSYKNMGLNDKIIWLGKKLDRSEIQEYFAMADLLLFPSVFDTNGLVVREAASCGTASLLIKGSCAAEGIADCRTGFLCEENAESIAAKLLEISGNRALLKTVGKNAQSEIYLSWKDAVANALQRYHIVIDKFYSEGRDKEPFKY